MEELDDSMFSIKPTSSDLAVQIIKGSFAWDSVSHDKSSYVDKLRTAACRRQSAARKSSKGTTRRHGDDDDDDVRPDPVTLLYEAVLARDDSTDVLFDINFTVAKVTDSCCCCCC